MTTYHADYYDVKHDKIVTTTTVPDGDVTLEGDLVVWDVDETLAAAKAIDLLAFSSARRSCFTDWRKVLLVVKCSSDASSYDVDVDYDSSTLYTFNSDCSTTPKYAAFKLTAAGAWQLA